MGAGGALGAQVGRLGCFGARVPSAAFWVGNTSLNREFAVLFYFYFLGGGGARGVPQHFRVGLG